jgi:uncharacterized protein YndB with AHSA1/START domain
VWAYLTDGEKRGKWLASGPMELRVGGKAELFFRHADLSPTETPPEKYKQYHDPGDTMIAQVTQCEPPRLLSYTWGSALPGEGSEVTFELTPQGEEVKLVLTHRRLAPNPEERAGTGAGWHTHIAILIAHLSGAKPPPFWATHGRLETEYAKRFAQDPAVE